MELTCPLCHAVVATRDLPPGDWCVVLLWTCEGCDGSFAIAVTQKELALTIRDYKRVVTAPKYLGDVMDAIEKASAPRRKKRSKAATT